MVMVGFSETRDLRVLISDASHELFVFGLLVSQLLSQVLEVMLRIDLSLIESLHDDVRALVSWIIQEALKLQNIHLF